MWEYKLKLLTERINAEGKARLYSTITELERVISSGNTYKLPELLEDVTTLLNLYEECYALYKSYKGKKSMIQAKVYNPLQLSFTNKQYLVLFVYYPHKITNMGQPLLYLRRLVRDAHARCVKNITK